jgi:protein-ribulosamine 3-kinase
MKADLKSRVENKLRDALGTDVVVNTIQSLSGGCINQTWIVRTNQNDKFFVKANEAAPRGMFGAEADGLFALQAAASIRIPKVIEKVVDDDQDFLILEAIETIPPARDFYERLGRRLAQMHLNARFESFGWPIDNYIGATPQTNRQNNSWLEFWRTERLEFQLKIARRNGHNGQLIKLGNQLVESLDNWLDCESISPCLLHGDLWSGNYLCDNNGDPVLIDPAVYAGHHEAEFGMISLYGGVNSSFYVAYREVLSFSDGSTERIAIYRLYHLLNHLNLFGAGYYNSCIATLKQIL